MQLGKLFLFLLYLYSSMEIFKFPATRKQTTMSPNPNNTRANIPQHQLHSMILAHQRMKLAADTLAEVRCNCREPRRLFRCRRECFPRATLLPEKPARVEHVTRHNTPMITYLTALSHSAFKILRAACVQLRQKMQRKRTQNMAQRPARHSSSTGLSPRRCATRLWIPYWAARG